MPKKVICTIEARMGSTRLPGKVLMPLAGEPSLQRMVERIRQSKYIKDIIIATTINKADDKIVNFCRKNKIKYYRGSEYDVLDRIYQATKSINGDIIVALTGDCPLVDYRHINKVLETLLEGQYDYVSNAIIRSFPDGFDVQAFPMKVLEKVDKLTTDPIDRVHVTYYIYQHPEKFKIKNIKAKGRMNWPDLGITLDERADYKLINIIFEKLLIKDPYFSAEDVVDFLLKNPKLIEINQQVKRKKPEEG